MKIYFANMVSVKGVEKYLKYNIDILASYSKLKEINKPVYCNNLFIDSGAFGKNSGKINIGDYIDFLKSNLDEIYVYANLDVIGDERGSYKNLIIMEGSGLFPLPVFHFGSEIKWLRRMIMKYEYIALGGLVPISGNYKKMRQWLDYIWSYIVNNSSELKVHGFGIQNINIIKRYPWYSIDSSSVHIMARYGGIYSPVGTLKINPGVNSREARWQLRRPKELKVIREHVEKYLDNVPFEVVRGQDKEGILSRCAVSIHFLVEELQDFCCDFQSVRLRIGD